MRRMDPPALHRFRGNTCIPLVPRLCEVTLKPFIELLRILDASVWEVVLEIFAETILDCDTRVPSLS